MVVQGEKHLPVVQLCESWIYVGDRDKFRFQTQLVSGASVPECRLNER